MLHRVKLPNIGGLLRRYQMTLAGGRGTEAYTKAVVEGREVPSMSNFGSSGSR